MASPVSQSTAPPHSLKGRFPFRLGTSSYIIPDDILANVRFLAPLVDDVELILFESDEIASLPDAHALAELAMMAEDHDLTYTVHLPLDIQLGSADEAMRRSSVAKCLRVFRLADTLDPHAWVVHFHGPDQATPPAANLASWQASIDRSVRELLAGGMSPHKLAVETLDYPFELVMSIVEDHNLGTTVDVGHLLLGGHCPLATMRLLRDRCRVVHLHGVRNGTDHLEVGALDRELLSGLYAELTCSPELDCVVTLEVFDRKHFEQSMHTLGDLWP